MIKIILLLVVSYILYKLINRYTNLFIIGTIFLIYYYKPNLIYELILLFYNSSSNKNKPIL